VSSPTRRRLPEERQAIVHRFQIAKHKVYMTVSLFEDGQPGELFLNTAKEGSTISGLLSTVAILTSMALQYGVPLATLTRKFSYTNFEPSGWTSNPEIRHASSIVDYVFRWLAGRFGHKENVEHESTEKASSDRTQGSPITAGSGTAPILTKPDEQRPNTPTPDAPACKDCGTLMYRSGACYCCPCCGSTSGCS
jgi:ribonucleoside-diphosphate reductase alpha chain